MVETWQSGRQKGQYWLGDFHRMTMSIMCSTQPPLSRTHLRRPVQDNVVGVDEGKRARRMLGAMHPESLTFSGGQFREDLKVLGLT